MSSDRMRYSLYDGRFSHAGLADEHGVVLLAPAQNLDDAGNLGIPPHHRVQLALAGRLGNVEGEFLDIQLLFLGLLFRSLGRLLLLLGSLLLLQHSLVLHIGQQAAIVYPMAAQVHLAIAFRGTAKRQQQMLRTGLGALESRCLHHSDTEHVLRLPGKADMVYLLVGNGLVGKDTLVNERLQVRRFYPQALERFEGHVILVTDDAQEQVVGADAVTARAHGFFPRIGNDAVQVFGNLQLHTILAGIRWKCRRLLPGPCG